MDDIVCLFFLLLTQELCGAATTVRLTVPGRFFPRAAAELTDTGGALIVIGIWEAILGSLMVAKCDLITNETYVIRLLALAVHFRECKHRVTRIHKISLPEMLTQLNRL